MSWFMCWLALTLNIYTEAGGEGEFGMTLIADTVVTRVENKNYPDNIGKVILQPGQFSWTYQLRSRSEKGLVAYNRRLLKSKRMANPKEREAYATAMKVAYRALQPGYKPKYRYTHFYSGTDKPKWAKNKRAVKHGKHYFLK